MHLRQVLNQCNHQWPLMQCIFQPRVVVLMYVNVFYRQHDSRFSLSASVMAHTPADQARALAPWSTVRRGARRFKLSRALSLWYFWQVELQLHNTTVTVVENTGSHLILHLGFGSDIMLHLQRTATGVQTYTSRQIWHLPSLSTHSAARICNQRLSARTALGTFRTLSHAHEHACSSDPQCPRNDAQTPTEVQKPSSLLHRLLPVLCKAMAAAAVCVFINSTLPGAALAASTSASASPIACKGQCKVDAATRPITALHCCMHLMCIHSLRHCITLTYIHNQAY